MKKALVLFGSPHKCGKTSSLLNYYLKTIQNFKITRIDVFDINFKYCTDCGFCKKKPNCIHSDLCFLEELYNDTDLIVIASPIHNLTLSAPMKALMDRTQKYFYARFYRNIKPYFTKPKKGFLILTGDSEDFNGVNFVQMQLKQTFSVINAEFVGILVNIGNKILFL